MSAVTEKPENLHSFSVLRQFVRPPQRRAAEHRCELCAKAIAPEHQHLLEVDKHRVTCACDACAILFSNHAAARYRRIPRDIRLLRDFAMDDHQWDSLLIPINLAFFFHSSTAGRTVAQYPSPAGAMESLLDLEYWQVIVDSNPVLAGLEPDVEALLVNRIAAPPQYYTVPIDHCYRLIGVIRTHWRGLSGGSEVWKEIQRFFDGLRQWSREVRCA